MEFFYAKWDARALRIAGADAADFLHRLSTTHVKRLAVGVAKPSLFLTGGGQMIASFELYRESDASFVLIADAPEFPALAQHLERMHFSENLERTELETQAWKFWRADAAALKRAWQGALLAWPLGSDGLSAAAVFGENARLCAAPAFAAEKSAPEFWEEMRIRAHLPRFGAEWDADARALDVGFLNWIDRDKGCYPGQEVVEKSLNLGHPARALVLVRGARAPAFRLPAELEAEGKPAGRLTSAAGGFGLAVVRWDKRLPGTRLTLPGSPGEFIVEKEES